MDFSVSEEKNRQLRRKMDEVGIREEDLLEKFIRASGNGGQKVNKTASCVYLKHLPSGIEIKCMKDRSQSLNRYLARRLLVEKLRESLGLATEKSNEAELIKKRKSRYRRRSKEKYTQNDS